jgi:23S rRNA (pseudouridine1915-N3)-methyltransferase
LHVIAVGRLRGPEAELFDRYNHRLRPRLTVVEVKEERGADAVVKREESAALLRALPPEAFAVALDLGGQTLDSERFADRVTAWQGLGRPVCFLIGGAEGLDGSVVDRSDFVLSLGVMTWPHFLVRAMLAEQLYRAQAIAQRHPYHRSGRPSSARRGS